MDLTILLVIGVFLISLIGGGGLIFLLFRSRKAKQVGPAAKREVPRGKDTRPSPVSSPSSQAPPNTSSVSASPATSKGQTSTRPPTQTAPGLDVPATDPTPSPSVSNRQPTTATSTQDVSPAESGPAGKRKIQIMIIDDNEETIGHVTRLLYFEDDIEVVGQANRARQGIEMALEKQPHIVLMDINMPDMDGIQATARLSERVPFSQVIMISVQSDPEYMKQAMQAGARDYQPKPFGSDELISTIRRVYERAQPIYDQFGEGQVLQSSVPASDQSQTRTRDRHGRVVAVYSPKGGVGTSTIAVNVAAVLQKIQGDVVLVDADLQFGDILVHLNTQASRSIADLVRADAFDIELLPEVLLTHQTGLHLLLAPPSPETAELITAAMLTQVIDELRNQFETIIVDTHNLLTDHTLTVLDNADYILVVTMPELPAIKNAKLFLDVSQELNLAAKRLDLVVNHADKEGGIPLKQIAQALKLPNVHPIPRDETVLINVNNGKAITEQNTNTAFAKAVGTMAKTLAEAFEQTSTEPQEELVVETA